MTQFDGPAGHAHPTVEVDRWETVRRGLYGAGLTDALASLASLQAEHDRLREALEKVDYDADTYIGAYATGVDVSPEMVDALLVGFKRVAHNAWVPNPKTEER